MSTSIVSRGLRVALGLLLAALGMALLVGGIWLIGAGGSIAYLPLALLLLFAAIGIARGDRSGAIFYAIALVFAVVWALCEVGFDLWALAPRLGLLFAIGLWMLMPWSGVTGASSRRAGRCMLALVVLAVLGVLMFALIGNRDRVDDSAAADAAPSSDWPQYGNTLAGDRYAPDAQITRDNVAGLRQTWVYHSGDLAKYDGFIPDSAEATPIKIGDRLFACSPRAAFAFDATSGKPLWRFEPGVVTRAAKVKACRGVAYYRVPSASGPCAERILWGTVDARLFAVDATSGQRCADFGNNGEVNLRDGMGEVKPGYYFVTSPPLVARNRVLVGGFVDDNANVDVPSGVIRAYDARSGQLSWAWDMGRPDRSGAPVDGETYTRSTPNAWAPFAADEALGLAFAPTGNPSPDFWGGKRRPFDERYGSSLVALDLDDGRPRWSFQFTHHDLWDYDTPSQPSLVDWRNADGTRTPAIVQSTKQGELFVLDHRTGAPLSPVEERPVPQGASEGDHLSPTQPFSVGMPTLRLPELREADMWGVTLLDQLACRIWFREARYDGVYTPPGSARESLTFPGSLGVTDWGGVAIDGQRHVLIANVGAIAYRSRLIPRSEAPAWLQKPPVHGEKPKSGEAPVDYWYNPQIGTPFVLHTRPFLGPLGAPCTQPPWGFLVAIDLDTRQVMWKRRIGTTRDSGPLGYPTGLPIPIGTPNIGGSLVTAGGLIFFSGTLDRYLRAYDIADGRELWRTRLPAGAQATPMSYVDRNGRQFVLVSAGGHVGLGTKAGDAFVAYALPNVHAPSGEAPLSH